MDENVINKLNKLYETKNIPNIIFHGGNLTGKKSVLEYLIKMIYKTSENIKNYVLIINCSHGKGNIKFIRENLKHFANTIINKNENYMFKSIILLNADKLTIDAQSALRRCIEIYNHSTRFFIIVDNKFKILKPILSRFSEIYCNKKINVNNDEKKINDFFSKKIYYLNKFIVFDDSVINLSLKDKIVYILNLTNKLYNNGFTGNMLLYYIKNRLPDCKEKYKFLFVLDIYKKEIRNELLIIMFCLNYIYFRNNINLENIGFI
jgi:DNA polymerase III delta prime subunit